MANKKTDENLKDKLKTFFRFSKEKPASVAYQRPHTKEFVFTTEILKVLYFYGVIIDQYIALS